MNLVVANIKWIMRVSGVLTCTMLYAAIAPQAALRSTFGATLEGPVAEIVALERGITWTSPTAPPSSTATPSASSR